MADKILYADDKESLRDFLGTLLEMSFPELDREAFKDGSSLEKRLNESLEGVRLVITDNDMPGIKGSEIIIAYAEKPEFKNISFILHYGGDPSLGEELVNKHGAFAYLKKPAQIEDITATIEKALNSNSTK